ncbi:MAG: histidine--tRNA ligase, partial [Oscillospiraceae bacterium]
EFHQFGVEMFGSASPCADADVISLAKSFIEGLGLKNIELFINSIGCPTCRSKYQDALREYFSARKDELCETCKERLVKNPMRILDCKSPVCSEIGTLAPIILDYLCDDCKEHFDKLKANLTAMGIDFKINPKIVRGLDYYTKTVFEFITNSIGAQGTVCGGGRYDGLVEELGGNPTPALGFAMGIERLILTMENEKCDFIMPKTCDLFLATMDENSLAKAIALTKTLRDEGYWVEYDVMGRGLKAQMKYANKLGAAFTMVLGEDELAANSAKLKNMASGEQIQIAFDDTFIEKFSNIIVGNMFGEVLKGIGG